MLITTFFWASGHPLGKIIVREVHPFLLGAVTLTVGFISLLIFLILAKKIKGLLKISIPDLILSFILGILGFFFYQILTFSALSRIPASINAILISTNVIFISLLAFLILRERLSFFRILGIILAAAGVAFVIFNRGFTLDERVDLVGIVYSLSAAISFALYSIFAKKMLERNDPLTISTISVFSGSIFLLILSSLTVGFNTLSQARSSTWALMIFLGVGMIGIAYPIWFTCLKRLKASHASVYIYMTPVFAVLLSLLILKESFLWPFWLGGSLVLSGIFTSNLRFNIRTEV